MKLTNLLPVFAGIFLMGSFSAGEGAITCTAADYTGTFAFYTQGALLQLPPEGAILLGPFAQSGTFTSDGLGNVTIESTASYNGLIQPGPATTTYTVTPDCIITFSLTLPFPLSVPSIFTGVLANRNREKVVMITDPPGTVVVGRHIKQDQRFCGGTDFRGSYAIDLSGNISAPRDKAGQFQRIGVINADGNGNFTATSIANYAGRVMPENFTGTYEVNAKCFVTLRYSSGGQDITINGPIGGHGDIAMVMVTTQGWAVSGSLKAQQ